jgi:hypothetical protein
MKAMAYESEISINEISSENNENNNGSGASARGVNAWRWRRGENR